MKTKIAAACVGSLALRNVRRPSIYYKDKESRSFCSAVLFESDIDPFDYCGVFFETIMLEVSPCEKWKFYNATISLLPVQSDQFVMIYERFERLPILIEQLNKTNAQCKKKGMLNKVISFFKY